MPSKRWLPGIRAVLTVGRELAGIRAQLTRIADAAEGIPPTPPPLPPLPPEPPQIHHSREGFAEQFHVEQRLAQQLGRPPTEDEVVRELDGVEWGRDGDA